MNFINIKVLRKGDRDEYVKAYPYLFAAAKSAAKRKLPESLFSESEDIATTAVCRVFEKLPKYLRIRTHEDLIGFTVSIAYQEACDNLRRHLSQKRGSGQVESTNEAEDDGGFADNETSVEKNIHILERAKLLTFLKKKLNPKDQGILDDWFMSEMSYSEIAQKHKIALGSVGVYINRALSAMKKIIQSVPRLEQDMIDLARLTIWLTGGILP